MPFTEYAYAAKIEKSNRYQLTYISNKISTTFFITVNIRICNLLFVFHFHLIVAGSINSQINTTSHHFIELLPDFHFYLFLQQFHIIWLNTNNILLQNIQIFYI